MKRLTAVLVFIFLFTAAFDHLNRVYSQKFLDITGEAQWIWARHRMSEGTPLAFFATREFDLPASRVFTHLKLLGDPEYTVFLNGTEIAGRRVGEDRKLDFYDLSAVARTGRNRLVVAVRAPQGAGGLIGAIDIAPEVANKVVTDSSWRIYRTWTPVILEAELSSGWESPMVIGAPPDGRWNYLSSQKQPLRAAPSSSVAPKASFEMVGRIPSISTKGGVAVAVLERKRATVFDFGFVRGHLRLNVEPHFNSRSLPVRYANVREELDRAEWIQTRVVVAPGETSVMVPEAQSFRYAMVFARDVRAELMK